MEKKRKGDSENQSIESRHLRVGRWYNGTVIINPGIDVLFCAVLGTTGAQICFVRTHHFGPAAPRNVKVAVATQPHWNNGFDAICVEERALISQLPDMCNVTAVCGCVANSARRCS